MACFNGCEIPLSKGYFSNKLKFEGEDVETATFNNK